MKKKKKPSKTTLKNKAWKLFSQWVRAKHADNDGWCECITCGDRYPKNEIQAGHAIGGRNNSVLFNVWLDGEEVEIVFPQCVRCNVFLRGNYPVYTTKMIRMYGLEKWERCLAESNKPKKISIHDYEEMIEDLKLKLRESNGKF